MTHVHLSVLQVDHTFYGHDDGGFHPDKRLAPVASQRPRLMTNTAHQPYYIWQAQLDVLAVQRHFPQLNLSDALLGSSLNLC